jgi:hypothetical protein
VPLLRRARRLRRRDRGRRPDLPARRGAANAGSPARGLVGQGDHARSAAASSARRAACSSRAPRSTRRASTARTPTSTGRTPASRASRTCRG